jgi:hypothetical protein
MKNLIKKLKDEKKVIEGDATKDKKYSSKKNFPDRKIAVAEFKRSVDKLFDINRWSDLPGISSKFKLYNRYGEEISVERPQIGDFVKILLPGPLPENWVVVTDIQQEEEFAAFTVSPSTSPRAKGKEREEIKHFFIDEATSTFLLKLKGTTILASEVGKNEGINNEGQEAGDRALINTLIAEGGWAGFQELQWEKLTDYLVHKIEIN